MAGDKDVFVMGRGEIVRDTPLGCAAGRAVAIEARLRVVTFTHLVMSI